MFCKQLRVSLSCFLGLMGAGLALSLPSMASSSDGYLYGKAVEAAKAGRRDAAYAYYNSILRLPQSRYHQTALFAKAEYFFLAGDFFSAKAAWNVFVQSYPDIPESLFALASCYYIARLHGDPEQMAGAKQQIVQFQQLSLVFRTSKEIRFLSPFLRRYRAVCSIDKIEFLIDDIPFETILY